MGSPLIINFPRIGHSNEGFISIAEHLKLVPFEVKRLFWTYYTPDSVVRGRHAHLITEMILIPVAGRIWVTTEMPCEDPVVTLLDNPSQGIYIPKLCWHTIQYSHNAVQLVIASTLYDESDYIRNYEEFRKIGVDSSNS